MRPETRGFSLIELLTVAVIVAVLAGLAIPSYRASLQRARRTDAQQTLLRLRVLQERHFLEQGRYAASLRELGDESGRSTQGLYEIDLRAAADRQAFVLRATPVAEGLQADDETCTAFSLDDTGRKTATGTPASDRTCWNGG